MDRTELEMRQGETRADPVTVRTQQAGERHKMPPGTPTDREALPAVDVSVARTAHAVGHRKLKHFVLVVPPPANLPFVWFRARAVSLTLRSRESTVLCSWAACNYLAAQTLEHFFRFSLCRQSWSVWVRRSKDLLLAPGVSKLANCEHKHDHYDCEW